MRHRRLARIHIIHMDRLLVVSHIASYCFVWWCFWFRTETVHHFIFGLTEMQFKSPHFDDAKDCCSYNIITPKLQHNVIQANNQLAESYVCADCAIKKTIGKTCAILLQINTCTPHKPPFKSTEYSLSIDVYFIFDPSSPTIRLSLSRFGLVGSYTYC